MNLTFHYSRKSTLPRREFVVNVRCFDDDGETFVQFEVTAPDPLMARTLVWRHMMNLLATAGVNDGFSVEAVREVVYVWHGDCHYKVPTLKVSEV